MEQQKTYDVFISYSRKDFDEVNAFVEMLRQRIPALNIWFDLDGIESGDEFRDKIISAIKRSKYVLFALSENSDRSEWTRKELQFAKGKNIKIVPILLQGVQLKNLDWFLFEFGGLDCIDITDIKQIEKVIKNLAKWTNKELIQNKIEPLSSNDKHVISTTTVESIHTSAPVSTAINSQEKLIKPNKKSWLWIPFGIAFLIVMATLGSNRYKVVKEREEYEIYVQDSIDAAHREALRLDSIRQQDYNGHEYVDLGLSVKWATCNVGANKPEEYGYYFAWGEITPNKTTYDWSTYKWCNGNYDSLTKYNNKSSLGTVDNKTQLELSDDVARANWGGSWRMPTDAELTELREKCTWTWTTQNGKNGYKVTSKSNGNSIFLPAAGYRYDSSLYDAGSHGNYWSSSLYADVPDYAWSVYFYSGYVYRYADYRYYGRSVRPVCP